MKETIAMREFSEAGLHAACDPAVCMLKGGGGHGPVPAPAIPPKLPPRPKAMPVG